MQGERLSPRFARQPKTPNSVWIAIGSGPIRALYFIENGPQEDRKTRWQGMPRSAPVGHIAIGRGSSSPHDQVPRDLFAPKHHAHNDKHKPNRKK
jgi:hypothetical protein